MIDLRSDTVTVPCDAMRQAMANAKVGDDVIDVDPTVKRLQDMTAEMLGKEAALFMPSGTMTNQIAVRYHCSPGDELICEYDCHIYKYEQGGFAQLSGVVAKTIHATGHVIEVEDLIGKVNPFDQHAVQTRLLCLENTHNRGGGKILPYKCVESSCKWARENGLSTHLDGARLFNAVVGSGIEAADWCKHFDTVSVCYSKGLGAPVGSALAGPREMIETVGRHRKLFGGGMRQSGIIAAGAVYALENNIQRLSVDHSNAKLLAEKISQCDGASVDPESVDTNIVVFTVDPDLCGAEKFCELAKEAGVWMFPVSAKNVRAVTHNLISTEDAIRAGELLQKVFQSLASDSSTGKK